MVVRSNRILLQICQHFDIEYAQFFSPLRAFTRYLTFTHDAHPQLLVEVAIVESAIPAHAHGVQTHQPFHCLCVVAVDQKLHVLLHLSLFCQKVCESFDWHIRYGQQIVELYPKTIHQLPSVIDLQRRLGGGKKGTRRVVHQSQLELRMLRGTVPGLVQLQKRGNRSREDPPTALGIDVVLPIAREGCHHVHLVLLQKVDEVRLIRLEEDR
mmetsp:Transcript_485/g.1104  ORF Transcript_485/g.1104 Transcript_485/m.1104 type:complete len:211 (-) Transcript_485:732-1364(-)